MSKVLEKIVFKQIIEHVEGNKILHARHHGSRAMHNTSTAVLEMHNKWINILEEGDMAAIMMLDLSAAFDLVRHDLLLQKLEIMGFDRKASEWMKSYLSGRSQQVYIDGQMS